MHYPPEEWLIRCSDLFGEYSNTETLEDLTCQVLLHINRNAKLQGNIQIIRGSAQPRLPQDTHRVDHQAPQAEPEGCSSIPSFFSVASTSGIAHDTLKFLLLFISHKYFHAYILTQKKHFLPK